MLKRIFPSLQGEAKELVLANKLLAGEEDYACVKEVLRRIVDTKAGAVALPERKLQELCNLLAIPTTQR